MMRSFGPLVWATTSPATVTPASALASLVTLAPSTTSRAGSATASPTPPVTFSTWTTSPTATLYCLPPVLTMAYTGDLLGLVAVRWAHRRARHGRDRRSIPDVDGALRRR